ncbi:MAG: hypothetical protein Q9169_007325 [Polycauliona sp. 2 TL-2023]
MARGMDPEVHLLVAEQTHRYIKNVCLHIISDRMDQEEALAALQQQNPDDQSSDEYKRLVAKIKSLRNQTGYAFASIREYEHDIAILKGRIEDMQRRGLLEIRAEEEWEPVVENEWEAVGDWLLAREYASSTQHERGGSRPDTLPEVAGNDGASHRN